MNKEELDRRIAIEIMGEPEPSLKPRQCSEYLPGNGTKVVGLSGNAWYSMAWRAGEVSKDKPYGDVHWEWHPLLFSSNMNLAMRAVDKLEIYELELVYERGVGWYAWVYRGRDTAEGEKGSTVSEAICHALLAFKESNGG